MNFNQCLFYVIDYWVLENESFISWIVTSFLQSFITKKIKGNFSIFLLTTPASSSSLSVCRFKEASNTVEVVVQSFPSILTSPRDLSLLQLLW